MEYCNVLISRLCQNLMGGRLTHIEQRLALPDDAAEPSRTSRPASLSVGVRLFAACCSISCTISPVKAARASTGNSGHAGALTTLSGRLAPEQVPLSVCQM